MGLLNARPKLEPGEQVRWQSLANRVVSAAIAEGGRLVLTDRRFFFQPNRFDAPAHRPRWEHPPEAVTGLEVVGRDAAIFSGGTRKRLGIETADGLEVFVVNRLKRKIARLRELLPGV